MRGSPVLPGGKTVFIKEDKIFPGSFSCFFSGGFSLESTTWWVSQGQR